MLYNAVRVRDDLFLPGGLALVYLRQILEAPPAAIVLREGAEIVPVIIGGSLSLAGAEGRVVSIAVEINTVRAGVGIHTVEDDADSVLRRRFGKVCEVLVRAEDRIDPLVVRGVVSVIGARLHDRIQIQAADAQFFQVCQLFFNAAQRAPVKIIRRIARFARARPPAQRLVDTFVQFAFLSERKMIRDPLFGGTVVRKGKAVRKDLIHHGAAEPFGRLKVSAVDRQAKAPPFDAADFAAAERLVRADIIKPLGRFHADCIP